MSILTCSFLSYLNSWFLRLAETVIQSLPNQSSGGLKLTAEMFEAAIARQQQPTLAERVAGLTHLQLHLLAAVCRLCFLPDAKRTVGTVLSDMDKLTGVFRRKDVSVDMVYLALHSLTEVNLLWLTNGTSSGSAERTLSTQYISHSTAVHLVPPPEEIQSLFHLKPLRCRQAKESHVEPTSIMSSISAAFTAVTGFESPLTIRAISGENIGLHPDLTILRSKRKRTAVVPRTGSLPAGNLFRSSPSASSKDATGSSSEKQWQNSWYCDESFHFRTQPTLVVSERVRKSVLEPHVPVLTTSLN